MSRDEMIAERNAMQRKRLAEMQAEKEPHLQAIRSATIEIEQIEKAYFHLMRCEADCIQQRHGFPGLLWKKP